MESLNERKRRAVCSANQSKATPESGIETARSAISTGMPSTIG
jgi:hypothetical protein